MSIDASWSARLPGLIAPAIIRGAIATAEASWKPLTLLVDDDVDLGSYGATADIETDGLGTIMLFQPDDDDDYFHLAISTSSGTPRDMLEEAFEVADAIAGELGLKFDGEDGLEETRAVAEERARLDVQSVRVEIDIKGEEESRVVSVEGESLARLSDDAVDALGSAVLAAASWALEGSERAVGRASLEDLIGWAEEGHAIIDREDDRFRFRADADEDGDEAPIVTAVIDVDLLRLWASPMIDLDLKGGLEMNDAKLLASALGIDSDGDWSLQTWARRENLGARAFRDLVASFLADLERLHDEVGVSDGDEDEDEDVDE